MVSGLRPKLAGIEIRLAWGWLAIAVSLVAVAIYELLPSQESLLDLILWLATALAVVGGGLLSLAAHDVAHVIVSRRQGNPIRSISPALIGTLPDTLCDPEDPRSDAMIAAAGPLMSAVVTIVLGVVWLTVERSIELSTSSVLGLLTLGNAALLLASLMPGYPFDGSRILRGFIWYVTDDLFMATKIVAYYGYVLALLGMAGGVVLIASGDERAIWGAFVVLTFWVINRSIADGVSHVFWTVTGNRLRVDDVFTGGGRHIAGSTTVEDAIEQLLEAHNEASTVVLDDGQPVGIIDLATIRPVPRSEWPHRSVSDVMRPIEGRPRIATDAPLRDLLDLLPPGTDAEVLLTRDDRVIGALNRRQVVQKIREYLAAEQIERMRTRRR